MVKKNKKTVAIVQARLTSKRFPNKVIKKIGNLTVIELILKRLVRDAFVMSVANVSPFVKFHIIHESIVPEHTSSLLILSLTPSTLSIIQAIFVAEK